jgi:hypothetical protein
LFNLTIEGSEALANRAGLSLAERENGIADVARRYHYTGKYRDLFEKRA